jgi:Bacterial low temperature requirement A protein (LtrA)
LSDLAEADPAGSAAAAEPAAARLLRNRSGSHRVTNIELFFDLVYVFAVTQLSHYLMGHSTVPGALQAGLLLVMIWLVWVYTTWVTNWLDPDQMAVRLLLVVLMLISLAMSASLPRAFEDLGLWVGVGYAVQQIGRSVSRTRATARSGSTSPRTSSGSHAGDSRPPSARMFVSCRCKIRRSPWRSGCSSTPMSRTSRPRSVMWHGVCARAAGSSTSVFIPASSGPSSTARPNPPTSG